MNHAFTLRDATDADIVEERYEVPLGDGVSLPVIGMGKRLA